jgi:hypothetical protein
MYLIMEGRKRTGLDEMAVNEASQHLPSADLLVFEIIVFVLVESGSVAFRMVSRVSLEALPNELLLEILQCLTRDDPIPR